MAIRPTRRRIASATVDLLDAGKSPQSVAAALASYLYDNKMTRDYELLLRDIRAELAKRHGLVAVDVVSARTLSDHLRKEVEHFVKSATGAKTIEMIETIDPGLIGGVVVATQDAEMDASVRTKLRKLRSI